MLAIPAMPTGNQNFDILEGERIGMVTLKMSIAASCSKTSQVVLGNQLPTPQGSSPMKRREFVKGSAIAAGLGLARAASATSGRGRPLAVSSPSAWPSAMISAASAVSAPA